DRGAVGGRRSRDRAEIDLGRRTAIGKRQTRSCAARLYAGGERLGSLSVSPRDLGQGTGVRRMDGGSTSQPLAEARNETPAFRSPSQSAAIRGEAVRSGAQSSESVMRFVQRDEASRLRRSAGEANP